jgi:hypothetical protein
LLKASNKIGRSIGFISQRPEFRFVDETLLIKAFGKRGDFTLLEKYSAKIMPN